MHEKFKVTIITVVAIFITFLIWGFFLSRLSPVFSYSCRVAYIENPTHGLSQSEVSRLNSYSRLYIADEYYEFDDKSALVYIEQVGKYTPVGISEKNFGYQKINCYKTLLMRVESSKYIKGGQKVQDYLYSFYK